VTNTTVEITTAALVDSHGLLDHGLAADGLGHGRRLLKTAPEPSPPTAGRATATALRRKTDPVLGSDVA